MKKFVLSIIIAASGLIAQNADAQVGVNVGLRIGPLVINVHKPIAPAVVYDDFYYLPEVDAYYSVPEHCYYYNDGYDWVNAAYLPGRYHDYNWRTARRYEVRAQRPYANHEYYRNKFGGSRESNWNDQYASRAPRDRNDRDHNGRFPSSPYDSNNATVRRGGRGTNDNNQQKGSWDNQQRNNRNNNRGNSQSAGQNGNRDENRRNGGNDGQRYIQNNGQDNRTQMTSVKKLSF